MTESKTHPLSGGCLCGAVRYEITAPVTELRACHCLDCQRASGAAGSINAVVPSAAFAIKKGDPKHFAKRSDSGRTLQRFFCGTCGSPVYSRRVEVPEMVVVRAGTLDDSSGMKITANIWTASARSWAYIDPATKQHPGQPDAPAPR